MRRGLRAVREALATLFPVRCAGCGSDDWAVCDDCRAALAAATGRLDRIDGLPLATAGDYDERMRRLLDAYKEHGRADVAGVLGPLLRRAIAGVVAASGAGDTGPGGIALVAVPSRRAARARRGYDHVALLAQKAMPRAPVVGALELVRPVRDQAALDVAGRAANLHGAMRARPEIAGRRCIVIDDVVTTGATAREAVRALRTAGAVPLGIAAVARVPLQSDHNE